MEGRDFLDRAVARLEELDRRAGLTARHLDGVMREEHRSFDERGSNQGRFRKVDDRPLPRGAATDVSRREHT
jgi:hypothetical protein